MKIKYFLLLFCLPLLIGCSKQRLEIINKNTPVSEGTAPVELAFTNDELEAIGKWKRNNLSYEVMADDALNGDKAALYMIGMGYLTGMPSGLFTIDIETANCYFSLSASLGFAPALNKIRSMYLEDCPNPWLMLVYLNLAASLGHQELLLGYHKLRTQAVEQFGQDVVQEIEKIAACKYGTILQNQIDLEKAVDKKRFLLGMQKITDEDSTFNSSYWQNIWQKSKAFEK